MVNFRQIQFIILELKLMLSESLMFGAGKTIQINHV